MADAVEGTFDRMDMFVGVPHRRIPFGSSFGGHSVALGILYYRLRDILQSEMRDTPGRAGMSKL
jgi:hypothetical protein